MDGHTDKQTKGRTTADCGSRLGAKMYLTCRTHSYLSANIGYGRNTFGEVKNSWSYGMVVVTCRSFVGLLVVS